MTILPNLLITGILAVLFSALFTGWAIFFARRKQGGPVLILLAVLMLLFGGGIYPPILGALIGAAATRIQRTAAAKPVKGLARLLFLACWSSIQHDRMQYTRSASTLRRHQPRSA